MPTSAKHPEPEIGLPLNPDALQGKAILGRMYDFASMRLTPEANCDDFLTALPLIVSDPRVLFPDGYRVGTMLCSDSVMTNALDSLTWSLPLTRDQMSEALEYMYDLFFNTRVQHWAIAGDRGGTEQQTAHGVIIAITNLRRRISEPTAKLHMGDGTLPSITGPDFPI